MAEEESSIDQTQELQRIGNGHLPDHPSLHVMVPDKIVYTHTRGHPLPRPFCGNGG